MIEMQTPEPEHGLVLRLDLRHRVSETKSVAELEHESGCRCSCAFSEWIHQEFDGIFKLEGSDLYPLACPAGHGSGV